MSELPLIQAMVIPTTPLEQNTSLVWATATKEGAFIDPGGEVPRLLAAAEQAGVTVTKILLTHGHADHAGAAKELSERLGVPVEGPHEDDRFLLDALANSPYAPGARPVTPDRWLKDGETVFVGPVGFEVVHCPGHTPGHVVFVQTAMRVAFVGDVLFQGSIGRTDFPRGNHGDLIASITEKLFPMGDDIAFVPGHGPMSTFGAERANNPYVSDRALGRG